VLADPDRPLASLSLTSPDAARALAGAFSEEL
jgi:hypothetical protein